MEPRTTEMVAYVGIDQFHPPAIRVRFSGIKIHLLRSCINVLLFFSHTLSAKDTRFPPRKFLKLECLSLAGQTSCTRDPSLVVCHRCW